MNDRLSLFGSAAYQVSTSEGLGVSTTGMEVAAGSNGFFDIDFGIRCEISSVIGWNRWGQEPSNAQSAEQMFQSHVSESHQLRHNWPRFAVNTVASVAVAYVGKTVLKAVVNEEDMRPWRLLRLGRLIRNFVRTRHGSPWRDMQRPLPLVWNVW